MRELTQNLVVYGRGKNCRLEIGRQVDGEHIGRFVRWTRRLWIRRAQGYEGWIQAIPYARLRVSGFGGDRIDSGNALEIRQRWHVHKRKTRHPRVSDHVQKRTHRVVQVLWLLHRQYDEVVIRWIDHLRCFGIKPSDNSVERKRWGAVSPLSGSKISVPRVLINSAVRGGRPGLRHGPP